MSDGIHGVTADIMALVVVVEICRVPISVVRSDTKQFQPLAAAGKAMSPLLAVPPLPTLTVNAEVPLLFMIDDPVPKPLTMVGAEADIASFDPTDRAPLMARLPPLGIVTPDTTESDPLTVRSPPTEVVIPVGARDSTSALFRYIRGINTVPALFS